MSSSSPSSISRRHLSLCAVCGDKASGKHYGVMSCDGCRGFFKRSVRRQIQYKCKGDSTCQVDVHRRNQCQACRFQRCLAVQMKPSAVQNERAPRLAAKRHPLQTVATATSVGISSTTNLVPPPPAWTPPGLINTGYVKDLSPVSAPNPFLNLPMTNVSSPIWSTSRFALHQNSLNLSKSSSSADETHSSLDMTNDDHPPLAMICETASFILLESIRWLYSVPSFKELNENDQLVLMEQSWSAVFLVTSAEMKKFLDQNSFDDDHQYLIFQSLIRDLLTHSIDSNEYTLLKLILIFNNPQNRELHERFVVEKFRKDALFMLTEYTRNAKYRRLAELLMLLSSMQEKVFKLQMDQLFFRHLIDRISMKDLLHSIRRHLISLVR